MWFINSSPRNASKESKDMDINTDTCAIDGSKKIKITPIPITLLMENKMWMCIYIMKNHSAVYTVLIGSKKDELPIYMPSKRSQH